MSAPLATVSQDWVSTFGTDSWELRMTSMPTAPEGGGDVLELPDWLPPAVSDEFHSQMLEVEGDQEEIIVCLACDARMKKVWRELYKKTKKSGRPSNTFMHPAKVDVKHTKRSKQQTHSERSAEQDLGVRLFFRQAFHCAKDLDALSVVSRSDINRAKAPYLQAAQQLNRCAKALRSFGMPDDANELEGIASRVKERWREDYEDAMVVERQRSRRNYDDVSQSGLLLDPTNMRGYVINLAKTSSEIFGSPLYGILAIVANVVFALKDETAMKGAALRSAIKLSAVFPGESRHSFSRSRQAGG
jgi:hypothetical protein